MKISKESWLQIIIAVVTIIASALIPEIRSFLGNIVKNFPVLLIVIGIVGVFYLQTIKLVKSRLKSIEKDQQLRDQQSMAAQAEWQNKLDEKYKKINDIAEHQESLIKNMLTTNSLHLAITRDVTLPIIYREYKEDVIKNMYYNVIQIPLLQEYKFGGVMITEYEKFYHQKEIEKRT